MDLQKRRKYRERQEETAGHREDPKDRERDQW